MYRLLGSVCFLSLAWWVRACAHFQARERKQTEPRTIHSLWDDSGSKLRDKEQQRLSSK